MSARWMVWKTRWLAGMARAGEHLRVLDRGLEGWRVMERPRQLVLVIAGTLTILFLWAAFAKVDRVVRGEGRVIPASRSQVIQHLEGGIVSALGTREGMIVRKGDVLLSISDTGAGSRLGELQVKLTALRAKIARLAVEVGEEPGVGTVDAGNKQADVRQEAETTFLKERQNKMRNEVDVLREQGRQKRAEISDLETRHGSVSKELEIARSQQQVMAGLAAKNAASQLELLESRGKVQKLVTELGEIEGAIPKARAALGEIEAKIRVTHSQFRTDARSELTAARTELDRMSEEERAEKDRVARTDIRAPVDGVVNRLYFNTLGGVVRPGDAVMEITPLDGHLLVEGKVSPAERGELVVGLPARARISAYDFGIYGTLPGKLVEISADTVSEERGLGNPQGKTFYRVQVEVDTSRYREQSLPVLPGMTGTVDIVVGQRTVLRYLLSPLLRFNYHVFQESK